jgi:hypothetical protein
MLNENLHPSDQELLLSADGELPRRRAAWVRTHLAACWECRARMGEIEGTIADFVRAHHQSVDPKLPPIAGPRALLKAQLARSAEKPHGQGWHSRLSLKGRGFAYVCALALFVMLGAAALYWQRVERKSVGRVYAGLLPDRTLTPGATRPVAIGDICSMDRDEVIRPVSRTLQQKVFQEYGMRDAPVDRYEVDYLITPGLGGADDIRNLWPEPRYDTMWNSTVKDQLEDHLHQLVCGGKLSLATAQKDVASDWISAYKKYFHTDEPLPRSSALDLFRSRVSIAPGTSRTRSDGLYGLTDTSRLPVSQNQGDAARARARFQAVPWWACLTGRYDCGRTADLV